MAKEKQWGKAFEPNANEWVKSVEAGHKEYIKEYVKKGKGASSGYDKKYDKNKDGAHVAYEEFKKEKLKELAAILQIEVNNRVFNTNAKAFEAIGITENPFEVKLDDKGNIYLETSGNVLLDKLANRDNVVKSLNEYLIHASDELIKSAFYGKDEVIRPDAGSEKKWSRNADRAARAVVSIAVGILIAAAIIALVVGIVYAAPYILGALGVAGATAGGVATTTITAVAGTGVTISLAPQAVATLQDLILGEVTNKALINPIGQGISSAGTHLRSHFLKYTRKLTDKILKSSGVILDGEKEAARQVKMREFMVNTSKSLAEILVNGEVSKGKPIDMEAFKKKCISIKAQCEFAGIDKIKPAPTFYMNIVDLINTVNPAKPFYAVDFEALAKKFSNYAEVEGKKPVDLTQIVTDLGKNLNQINEVGTKDKEYADPVQVTRVKDAEAKRQDRAKEVYTAVRAAADDHYSIADYTKVKSPEVKKVVADFAQQLESKDEHGNDKFTELKKLIDMWNKDKNGHTKEQTLEAIKEKIDMDPTLKSCLEQYKVAVEAVKVQEQIEFAANVGKGASGQTH